MLSQPEGSMSWRSLDPCLLMLPGLGKQRDGEKMFLLPHFVWAE